MLLVHEVSALENDLVDVIITEITGYGYTMVLTTTTNLLKVMNALSSERNKREGNKLLGFFRDTRTNKVGEKFLKHLTSWGYTSHIIFMAYPGYLSASEKHIFSPSNYSEIIKWREK